MKKKIVIIIIMCLIVFITIFLLCNKEKELSIDNMSLREKIGQITIDDLELPKEQLSAVQQMVSELDNADFGVTGYADVSDIINKAVAARTSIEELGKIAEAFGYEFEWEQNGFSTIQVPFISLWTLTVCVSFSVRATLTTTVCSQTRNLRLARADFTAQQQNRISSVQRQFCVSSIIPFGNIII